MSDWTIPRSNEKKLLQKLSEWMGAEPNGSECVHGMFHRSVLETQKIGLQ